MYWIDSLKPTRVERDDDPNAIRALASPLHSPSATFQPGARPRMRPENLVDWIAFAFLLLGAFAWGYYATQINIFTVILGRLWDPLDDLVYVLIAASGAYWLRRVLPQRYEEARHGDDERFP